MNVLLDTHVWIWLLLDPERVRQDVRDMLVRADTTLHLSPINAWEAMYAVQRGSVAAEVSPREWVKWALAAVPHRDAPLTSAVAILSREIDVPHRDPGDRFLAASAAVYDLTLVTADKLLLSGTGYQVLAAA